MSDDHHEPDAAPKHPKTLFGAKAVIAFLRVEYGFTVTRMSLWRMRLRKPDPFPAEDRLIQRRQHLVASTRLVRAWAQRNLSPEAAERLIEQRNKKRG